MGADIKISVIIPVYNAEKHLEECLDSVLNQTMTGIEIICVDDGSTDQSSSILMRYEAEHESIKCLFQQNQYAGAARNAGMAIAQGKYFAFLDSDDYYVLDGLEKLYSLSEEFELDFIKARSYLLDSVDHTTENTTKYYSNGSFEDNHLNKVLRFENAPRKFLNIADVPWNALYLADFVREKGLQFNGLRCVNDHSFYIGCLISAQRIMLTDSYLAHYRINQGDSLIASRSRHFDCQISSYNIVRDSVSGLKPDMKRLVLQQELNQLFIWYDKLLLRGQNAFQIEQRLWEFIKDYDSSDVGSEYLRHFEYSYEFNRLYAKSPLQVVPEPVKAPKVSIVIPIYNGSRYLPECIESVLSQTLSELEIICIDDGSTDDTLNLLRHYSELDKRLTIIQQENQYAGVARNTGVRASQGEYLTFLDADDRVDPNFAQALYDEAVKAQADVVVSPLYAWSGKNGKDLMRHWLQTKHLPSQRPFSYLDMPEHILTFTPGGPGGKLFRREFILENKLQFLDIKRSEDFSFVLVAIAAARAISTVDKAFYYYRQNNALSLESTKDETPTLFWDANMIFKVRLQELEYFDLIKQSYLNNSINRFAFNLQALKTAEGFELAFRKLHKVFEDELELNAHTQDYFFSKENLKYLQNILAYDTCIDYLFAELKRSKRDRKRFIKSGSYNNLNGENEAALIRSSASFRIGRFITFIPRKIRGGIRCYQQNGISYTLHRVKEKFSTRRGR